MFLFVPDSLYFFQIVSLLEKRKRERKREKLHPLAPSIMAVKAGLGQTKARRLELHTGHVGGIAQMLSKLHLQGTASEV